MEINFTEMQKLYFTVVSLLRKIHIIQDFYDKISQQQNFSKRFIHGERLECQCM